MELNNNYLNKKNFEKLKISLSKIIIQIFLFLVGYMRIVTS